MDDHFLHGHKKCSTRPKNVKSRSIPKSTVVSMQVICEKKYVGNFLLDNHMRERHLPNSDPRRYFPCRLCNVKLKSYNQFKRRSKKSPKKKTLLDNIIRHMGAHSPIRPTCNYCQKEFVCTSDS